MALTTNYWDKEIIASGGGYFHACDLKIDTSGNPHLLYSDSVAGTSTRFMRYATRQSGVWVIQTIAQVTHWFPASPLDYSGSLFLHPVTGVPHVVYTENGGSEDIYNPIYQVSYAYLDGSTWRITQNIASAFEEGQSPEIVISADGRIHVVYQYYVYHRYDCIRYATSLDGVNWSYQTIEPEQTFFTHRIYGSWTVDSSGVPCLGGCVSIDNVVSVIVWKRTGNTWARYTTPAILPNWPRTSASRDVGGQWSFLTFDYATNSVEQTWDGSSWSNVSYDTGVSLQADGNHVVNNADLHHLMTATDDFVNYEVYYLMYLRRLNGVWLSEVILDYDTAEGVWPFYHIALVNNSPVAVCSYVQEIDGLWAMFYLQRPHGHVYTYNVQVV